MMNASGSGAQAIAIVTWILIGVSALVVLAAADRLPPDWERTWRDDATWLYDLPEPHVPLFEHVVKLKVAAAPSAEARTLAIRLRDLPTGHYPVEFPADRYSLRNRHLGHAITVCNLLQYDAALAVLQEGRAFGIYPEGTRSRDGRLYKGRTGVAWLALTAGVPVVPVGVRGTDRVQPIGTSFPRLGAHVTVRFGTPISPEPYVRMPAGKARRALTDEVMDAIAALSGQERADSYNELPPESTGAAVGI